MSLTFQELKKRIDENDNRSTAKPYLLLLREKREYVAHDEYGDHECEEYVEKITGDHQRFESFELLEKYFKEDYYNEIDFSQKFPDGLEEGEHYEFLKFGENEYTINVFLTDKGYQEHMNMNRHNIGKHDTYGIHAFRNPEVKKMFEAIDRVVELEAENESLKKRIKEISNLIMEG